MEKVFVSRSRIIHLHAGAQVIRTTAEHPFWAQGRGWSAAGELRPGDRLVGYDGQSVAVEEVYDTGEPETVYNLRVPDYHTYFVGHPAWGWNAWAHNAFGDCGAFQDLKEEAGLHRHHVPQVVVGEAAIDGFTRDNGPAIHIPDWMHHQIRHVTLEGFQQDQGGDIIGHIADHLRQLENMGVPPGALDDLRWFINRWIEEAVN